MNVPASIQGSLFSDRDIGERKRNNGDLIKSVSRSTQKIMSWIQQLYFKNGIDLDCTFRVGGIYKGTDMRPRIRTDINPQAKITLCADFTALPFKSGSMQSVMFDPPFFANGGLKGNIRYKYGCYSGIDELLDSYRNGLREIKRVMTTSGYLVMKCQDFVHGRRQYLIHADIIKFCESIGLHVQDLFIRINSHVPIAHNHQNQHHSRKFHCYYLVFKKRRKKRKTVSL